MHQDIGQAEASPAQLHLAERHGREADGQSKPKFQFVCFAISGDQYGVDIMAVREIKGVSGITHLPKQPDYVRGVLNLRGSIVPIVDLRCRFGEGVTGTTPLHIVIIVQIDGRQVGLIGDRVLDIVSVDAAQIQKVPHAGRGSPTELLSGLVTQEGVMIALIDLPNLLSLPQKQDGERLVGALSPPH